MMEIMSEHYGDELLKSGHNIIFTDFQHWDHRLCYDTFERFVSSTARRRWCWRNYM